MIDLKKLKSLAAGRKKVHKKVLDTLKRKNKGQVDAMFHETHEAVFAETDCLQCGNCCKTTGPLFTDRDIGRISKHLSMRTADFVTTYLRVDEDEDFVLQQLPCPFLGADNYCSIYEHRPKACREYPHTDRVKQSQLFGPTLKNAAICPAVFTILERIAERVEGN